MKTILNPVLAARGVWNRPPLTIPAPAPDRVPEAPPLNAPNPAHQPMPWPVNESDIDLPTEPASPERRGLRQDTHYLGWIDVRQARVRGVLSLEVLLHPTTEQVEIGPYRLDATQLRRLQRLLAVAQDLLEVAHEW